MEKYITLAEANRMIVDYDGHKIFTVVFTKRSDGTLRRMNCRKKVTKHLTGGQARYNPANHNLVAVYDMQKRAYRTISLETIKRITMKGIDYRVV
jgi:hypothetical protein